MKPFTKGDAWYVVLTVPEGELLGLYGEQPKVPAVSTRADGRVRKYGKERGLATDSRDAAMSLVLMMETAFEHAVKNPTALRLLTDMLRDGKLTMPQALGLWQSAWERVGKNATAQLACILDMRSKIELRPLVTIWNGGTAAGPRHHVRNVRTVMRFMDWYGAEHGRELTHDEISPRLCEAYLLSLLTVTTKFSRHRRKMSKRTVLYHRSALGLFFQWLCSTTAALRAGLADDTYVLQSNPIDRIENDEISQTRKDRRKWKANRVEYTQDEAKATVTEIDDIETRAATALMFGSMLEWGALYNMEPLKGPRGPVLFKRNFLRDKQGQFTRWFYAAGLINVTGDVTGPGLDKAHTRVRYLEVPDAEGFDFYWRIVESYLKTLREDDPFLSRHTRYYKARFEAALKRLGLPRQHGRLFHPCRHSFAAVWLPLVQKERADGRDLDWLLNQAGHEENSRVLWDIYRDGRRAQKAKATGEQVLSNALSQRRRGLVAMA